MDIKRTPDSAFQGLSDFPFAPKYTDIRTADGSTLRIHHVDEGPKDGPVVLCLHGQPTWSYLYRKMIPVLTAGGCRVIAPDLPGFGKSDKPASIDDYSYQNQVDWMGQWLQLNDFTDITFFGQDWGGLIGLRMIADRPERFKAVVISNSGLPCNPDTPAEVLQKVHEYRRSAPAPTLLQMSAALKKVSDDGALAFACWQKFCRETIDLPIGFMMSSILEHQPVWKRATALLLHRFLGRPLRASTALGRAYEAPFPDPSFKMAPRAMPSHVPTLSDDPSLPAQQAAWAFFETWEKPFICAFNDDDPITRGGDKPFRERIPGARGQPHITISGGGHFVQEKRAKELSAVILNVV